MAPTLRSNYEQMSVLDDPFSLLNFSLSKGSQQGFREFSHQPQRYYNKRPAVFNSKKKPFKNHHKGLHPFFWLAFLLAFFDHNFGNNFSGAPTVGQWTGPWSPNLLDDASNPSEHDCKPLGPIK